MVKMVKYAYNYYYTQFRFRTIFGQGQKEKGLLGPDPLLGVHLWKSLMNSCAAEPE